MHVVLKRLDGRLSPRKARLAACACLRRLRSLPSSALEVIALAERAAEGLVSAQDLAAARFAGRFRPGHPAWAVCWAPTEDSWQMMERALAWATGCVAESGKLAAIRKEEAAQADLLREIAGDPAQQVVLDPAWLAWDGGTVLRLARSIHAEGAFEQMPILGDALEEAGCADAAILTHCRRSEHVRGCWLLDRLLGLK